jgi:predicted Zn-dependent peptidase
MFKKITLKNGLRIITVPNNEAKTATTLILVKTGSKYESKNISGISHFLEHMFFKGTKKFKKPKDVAEFLDKIGGDFNAFTGEEYTGYYATVSFNHLNYALEWVSDIFLNSLIPLKEVGKERGVIIEEINMYRDNPMMYISQLWKEVLYGDQPAGWDIAGTKETVSKIKRQDILNYISSQYTAENTVICLAGKFDEKKIIYKIKKIFDNIRVNKPKNKIEVNETQKKPQSLIYYKDTGQTNLALGVRAYNMFHKDKYVCDVLAVILGGMMSSRLFEEVREKLGAAYYVRTYNETDTDTGSLVTFAGVDNNKLEKVISAILKEYKKIKIKKISEGELKKAKDYIKGKTVLGLESSSAQASFFATQELLKKEILTIEEIFKKIDKVTREDILRVSKDIFKNEKLNLSLIANNKNKKYNNLLKI